MRTKEDRNYASTSYGSFLQKRPISAQAKKTPEDQKYLGISPADIKHMEFLQNLQKRQQFNSPKHKEGFKFVDLSSMAKKVYQQPTRPKSTAKLAQSYGNINLEEKKKKREGSTGGVKDKENDKQFANMRQPAAYVPSHYTQAAKKNYNQQRSKPHSSMSKGHVNMSLNTQLNSSTQIQPADLSALKKKMNTLDKKIKQMNLNVSTGKSNFQQKQPPTPIKKDLHSLKQQIQNLLAHRNQKVSEKKQEEQKKPENSPNKGKMLFKSIKQAKAPTPQKISDFVTSVAKTTPFSAINDKLQHQKQQEFQQNTQKKLYFISQVISAFQSPEHTYPKDHFCTVIQSLNFCRHIAPPTDHQLADKKKTLPQLPIYKNKKTLVFDLDETLIHCNETIEKKSDVVLPITFENGEVIHAGINIRPYAKEILKEMSQHFEVIVFTASHSCYANVVLDHLDPHKKYIQHRLYRESCVQTQEGFYVKDLRVINRSLSDMVLIDNAGYSFAFQLDNGIPILNYYQGSGDRELKHLMEYLMELKDVRDVREFNRAKLKMHQYDSFQDPIKLLQGLYKQYIE